MNEQQTPLEPEIEAIPSAVLESKRRFSLVWLIPLVAALIGGWLAYKAYSEQGPIITIQFQTASGLEPGKTKVRFKDVEIGQVTTITLTPEFQVKVTAELVKGTEHYLTDKTHFWVERARVAAGEVSGLNTLFSGAYIGVDPVSDGERTRHFIGLEVPPVVTTREAGTHYVLESPDLGSLQIGSPIHYRKVKVGQIVSYTLDHETETVKFKIFIEAPYDQHIYKNTRFWNASGLDLKLGTDGVQIDTDSLVSLLIGGVSFDTPPSLELSEPAPKEALFQLFANKKASQEERYYKRQYYLLHFDSSVRGLQIGASVEFRGIQLGEVLDIRLEFDPEKKLLIFVLIAIEPERMAREIHWNENPEAIQERLRYLIEERSLRAQLKPDNFLTGQLYVDLDFHPDATPAKLVYAESYPVVPTVPAPIDAITNVVRSVLTQIQQIPIEQISNDLQVTIANLRQLSETPDLIESLQAFHATLIETETLIKQLRLQTAPELKQTLEQVQTTLAVGENLLEPESRMSQEIQKMLHELASAARSIRLMADYLERHPEALLRGKGTR